MAGIALADVTYAAANPGAIQTPGRVERYIKLTFSNNAANLDYPAGGIPLDKSKLGCPRGVASLVVLGRTPMTGAENPHYEWNGDTNAPKLVGYETTVAASPMAEATHTFSAANTQIIFIEVESA
jgi:hypothetical protein